MIASQFNALAAGGLHAAHRARLVRHQGEPALEPAESTTLLWQTLPASTLIGNESSERRYMPARRATSRATTFGASACRTPGSRYRRGMVVSRGSCPICAPMCRASSSG